MLLTFVAYGNFSRMVTWRFLLYLWRWGRDSNPWAVSPTSCFQDKRNRPLCHLTKLRLHSIVVIATLTVKRKPVIRYDGKNLDHSYVHLWVLLHPTSGCESVWNRIRTYGAAKPHGRLTACCLKPLGHPNVFLQRYIKYLIIPNFQRTFLWSRRESNSPRNLARVPRQPWNMPPHLYSWESGIRTHDLRINSPLH